MVARAAIASSISSSSQSVSLMTVRLPLMTAHRASRRVSAQKILIAFVVIGRTGREARRTEGASYLFTNN